MIENRFIRLSDFDGGCYIVEQSHRQDDFLPDGYNSSDPDGDGFVASNGVIIRSRSNPAWEDCEGEVGVLFVRGSDCDEDNRQIEISREDYDRVCVAVGEYNLRFGGVIAVI